VNTDEARQLLEKAGRAIGAAHELAVRGDVDFAASRAYYAMFYSASALLAHKGLHYRKHGGVHAAIGEQFVKAGLLNPRYHRWLLDAFDKRLVGDYGVDANLTAEDVERMIEQARDFREQVLAIINTAS